MSHCRGRLCYTAQAKILSNNVNLCPGRLIGETSNSPHEAKRASGVAALGEGGSSRTTVWCGAKVGRREEGDFVLRRRSCCARYIVVFGNGVAISLEALEMLRGMVCMRDVAVWEQGFEESLVGLGASA